MVQLLIFYRDDWILIGFLYVLLVSSCSPNSQIEKWFLNGEMSIGIFASQEIPAGSEISYDYNFSSFSGAQKQLCRCGAPNCRGYIGERTSIKKVLANEAGVGASSKSGKKKGDKRKGGHRRVSPKIGPAFGCCLYFGGPIIDSFLWKFIRNF